MLLFTEVTAFYEAYCQGREPVAEPSAKYGSYIAWLQQQDQSAAEAYWRVVMAGYKGPTSLWIDRMRGAPAGTNETSREQHLSLPRDVTTALVPSRGVIN